MKKLIILTIAVIAVVIITKDKLPSDFKDATYTISGEAITLTDGINKKTIPNSSSKTVTKYFGNEIYKDLNEDGKDDVVFILTQETGGSGIFYYITSSINTGKGYKGTEAIYIGDRIAPQNIQSGEGKEIIFNYADRAPTDSYATQPNIGKSIYLILDPVNNRYGEVIKNFEGEIN